MMTAAAMRPVIIGIAIAHILPMRKASRPAAATNRKALIAQRA
jgi:hypothetical protein